jgi:Leucine-rich repeat (LRR) protein
LLKVNKSVKTVKLIRNRLTDDFVERILPFIGNIVTLNFSQNYLTERTLEYIMDVASQLPLLRHVILSQNRIREKTCKNKLEEFKKMNITISF